MKTFANQSKLPRLPIPTLAETKERYLASMQPLLPEDHFAKLKNIANDFFENYGAELQSRLLEYEKQQKNSWLEDIWFSKAYLEYREPILINVNWFMLMKDHPAISLPLLRKKGESDFSDVQVSRAAGIIRYALEFNNMVNQQTLPIESSREGPFCMNQYKCMFGSIRIPSKPGDKLVFQYPTTAQHVILIIKDQLFSVQVLDPEQNIASVSEIKGQILRCLKLVGTVPQQPPVGILTAEHRDVWTDIYNDISQNQANSSTLMAIHRALFCVSLDDLSTGDDIDMSSQFVFHKFNGRNAWFDKTLSFNVCPNGRAGLNGEHSPCDAVVPGKMLDYVVQRESKEALLFEGVTSTKLAPPAHLKWSLTKKIEKAIQAAKINVQKYIDDNDTCVYYLEGRGSDIMKKLGVSPDGLVQMAMQLAFYRLHNYSPATYESASTRKFLHGRTECVRVCSNATVKFVKTFQDKCELQHKLESLKAALKSHSEYMKDATNGKGVDRHLLGLRCMMRKGETHEIFTDPSYGKGVNFELSTSNMSPGYSQLSLGFGPVTDTGYGINYAIANTFVKFSIGSKKSCSTTDSRQFRYELDRVFTDLFDLLLSEKAKL